MSRSLLINTKKLQEYDLSKNEIRCQFHQTMFFLGRITKKLRKVGPGGPLSYKGLTDGRRDLLIKSLNISIAM